MDSVCFLNDGIYSVEVAKMCLSDIVKPLPLGGCLLWDWFILVLTCRPAHDCSLFISLASLALLPDSLWGQRNSSIKLRAHLCPYSSQKEPSSTIRAFLQWYHHRAITRCKNRLQEIDLILIWQNYQERKLECRILPFSSFFNNRLCFKGEMRTLQPSCSFNNKDIQLIDLKYSVTALKSMLNRVNLT